VLTIALSTYYNKKVCELDPPRQPALLHRDAALRPEIHCVFASTRHRYGGKKVGKELLREACAKYSDAFFKISNALELEALTLALL
jgi:hypothetical protein